MNWIFPIAGFGTRTSKLGEYKPLIEVFENQSILKICLSGLKTMFNPEDVFVFICSEEQSSRFNVREKISAIFDELELKENWNLIEIDSTPNGQALTLKKAVSKIKLSGNTIVINSDQFIYFDYNSIDLDSNGVGLYFNDNSSSCFYELDIKNRKVLDIQEKISISHYASAGVYYFSEYDDILKCINWGIDTEQYYSDELYLGPCMKYFEDLKYFKMDMKFDLGTVNNIDRFKNFWYSGIQSVK